MSRQDTIAAIATAPGRAGVAIVRLSGPEALDVGARVAGRTLSPGLHFVRTRFDECVVLVFKSPKSYTGEDVVEFQCHGGEVTPRRILEACFASGARLARRGEFTERAFLNGKLDCVQAESVLDLIHAKTARAADAALEGLSGRSKAAYRALYDQALALSVELEHALDISEEELPESFFSSVREKFSSLALHLESILSHAHEGALLRKGALVVLAGPPNAGKSSLLNALLGESRAIVSDVPGTTRDSIEAWLDLEGYPVRLVDTAGLRQTNDAIEAEGVRRAEALIAEADVVVDLTPWTGRPAEGTVAKVEGSRYLPIHAKCDLVSGSDQTSSKEITSDDRLNVSALTGEGISELKKRIVSLLRQRSHRDESSDTPSERALSVLLEVEALLKSVPIAECDLVLSANALRTASERLATLVGAAYSSDLMETLFSRFCVGK